MTLLFGRQKEHTHTLLTSLCPGLPGWAGTRKVKPIWILLKQETVSGSGISWAICKSAPCSRQIATPAPHHSVYYRLDALPATLPTASMHWRHHRERTMCHNWVMRCWCGYLSGARCRLCAYGPADATASQNPIISCLIHVLTGYTFLVLAYPGCSGKEAIKQVFCCLRYVSDASIITSDCCS